jgi:hypothetical protein
MKSQRFDVATIKNSCSDQDISLSTIFLIAGSSVPACRIVLIARELFLTASIQVPDMIVDVC